MPEWAAGYASNEADFRRYARITLQSAMPHVPIGRLLDVGCSIGALVAEASTLGFTSQGIDLDTNAVEYGRSRGRDLTVSLLGDWPGRDYAVIVLQHTLEHVPDPIAVLRECRERLASGGCVLISVPCHDGLNPRILNRHWYGWQFRQHYWHFSREALIQCFRAADLTPVRVWQNPMDHQFYGGSLKQCVKSFIDVTSARVGAAIGRGDQLTGIAQN